MVEDTSKPTPRLRIGPSPTGDPHVGTAYIALFNYVLAKKLGGTFILRIEDTDQQRSQAGWEQMIFDALKWLGLTWSEGPDVGGPHGPYRQSERAEIYKEYTHKLIERGAAYPCFCTPERLEQLRLTQRQRGVAPGYDGACRQLNPADADARIHAGEVHVVRLKVPKEGTIEFTDALRGRLSFEAHQIDDQILQKSDGLPTYHLANVVDDHLMQITHVMRAEEWITSTPKHVLLYQGFGWELPEFIHMPLLRNADKTKISKRKNPVSLNYYKEAGYLPEVMLNYLAMMGWTMPDGREKFGVQDMVDNFDLSRISLGGPVFDVQKLTWLNGQYLREAPAIEVMKRWRDEALSDEKLAQIAPLVHERITKLEDIGELTQFFFSGEVALDAQAQQDLVPKNKTPKDALGLFEEVLAFIDAQTQLEASALEAAMRALSEKLGMKTKEVFMPLRVAVTGRRATPPLFDTMAAIGKERCRRRIRAAMGVLRSIKDA